MEQFNSVVQQLKQSDKEKAFESRLAKFNSSFAIQNAVPSKDKARKQCEKMKRELRTGYDIQEETVRSENLLAFLLWSIGERNQAFELIDISISKDPTNIISLSNKARFLWDCRELFESESVLKDLERLQLRSDFKDLEINAEAEIAYSLARLGPALQGDAAKLFEKVIEVKPKSLWKFGLALTYKRLSHTINAQKSLSARDATSTRSRAAFLFCDIIKEEKEEGSGICARSWCELGDIVHYNPNVKKSLEARFRLSSDEYFKRALQSCNDDTYVLQKYGKYLHCVRKFEQAEELLRRSIRLRDSSFARHHLALALTKSVATESHNKVDKPSASGHIESKERQSYESRRKYGIVETINSTKDLVHCPNNENLLEAVKHLQKAIELEDGQFSPALYDLGVTYRMLGKFQDAIFQFSKIHELEGVTLVEQIRAIEQIGFTKLDMAEENVAKDVQEKLIKEGKEVLMEALQLQAITFENLPNMKEAWKTYLALKAMADSVKELLRLHCLVKNYQEAFHLYESSHASDELDAEDHLQMIKMYEEIGNYDRAVLHMNNLLAAEGSSSATVIDQAFCVSLYIKAAADSLSRGMITKMVNYFNASYQHIRNHLGQKRGDMDIIIMHDCTDNQPSTCEQVLQIQKWMKNYIGLNVVIKDSDSLAGRQIQYEGDFEVCSTILVVVHGEREESANLQNAVSIPKYAAKIVILSDEELPKDIPYGNLPRLRLPKAEEEEGSEWIKEFIQHLQISSGDQSTHSD